jgi:chromosome segregation ATPase
MHVSSSFTDVEEMLHPDLSAQEAKSKLVIFMAQVVGEINQIKFETTTLNSEYREAEDEMNRANSETEDLEKSVCSLVKKAFHKASLLHHPDKLGEDVTDEQRAYWRMVQLGYDVMLRYANYSRSLLLPH